MAHKSLDEVLFEASWGTVGGSRGWRPPTPPTRMPDDVVDIPASYRRASEIAGPLTTPLDENLSVQFRRVATRLQRALIAFFVTADVGAAIIFLVILLLPRHFPMHDQHADLFSMIVARSAYASLILLETLRLLQSFTLGVFALAMKDPVPITPRNGLRVAVLTTIVPSKEPIELVTKTLRAMRALEYDGVVDVWILDEGDDPAVRVVAASLGVHHFSRNGRPEYNQPSGPFRARCKAGNHNAWRAAHEHEYDIVAQMDPDHLPSPEFLRRTLGYFRDPDVAFVVAPQVYGNSAESFVTGGAAMQTYVFHGAIQRGGNRLGAPLLIGTNHLYRVDAWRQIGGYQDSVIEDHLTSMQIHATINPRTGHHWRGIYTPDVLSIGEGPRSWTDYFNQQHRWAYGVVEILLNHSPRLLRAMPLRRAISYLCLQSYYPSMAILWLFGSLLTGIYLLFGIPAVDIETTLWLGTWLPTMFIPFAFFVYLRRFNLTAHERRSSGLYGMLLTLASGPIYLAAAILALARRPYAYVVTPKANKASVDSLRTFRSHVLWALTPPSLLIVSFIFDHDQPTLRFWAAYLSIIASLPAALFAWTRLIERRRGGQDVRFLGPEPLAETKLIRPNMPMLQPGTAPAESEMAVDEATRGIERFSDGAGPLMS